MEKVLSILLLCLITSSTTAQSERIYGDNEKKTLMTTLEWLNILESSRDSLLEFRNIELTIDWDEFTKSKYCKYNGVPELSFHSSSVVILNKCTIPFYRFYKCDINHISFIECEFTGRGSICFNESSIRGIEGWDTFKDEHLAFQDCNINGAVTVNNCRLLDFWRCDFKIDSTSLEALLADQWSGLVKVEDILNRSGEYGGFLRHRAFIANIKLRQGSFERVSIYQCRFGSDWTENTINLDFSGNEIDELIIVKSRVKSISLEGTLIKERIYLDSAFVTESLFLNNVVLPGTNSNLPWYQFANARIGILPGNNLGRKEPYFGQSDEEFAYLNAFNDLISEYNMLYTIYKSRGERSSANGCYVKMKDIETLRFEYLYEKDHSLENWFDWRFNQFLKYFSDYGTSPVKSLMISISIILYFSLFYFFVHSDWDGIDRKFFLERHRRLLHYFLLNRGLDIFYIEKSKDELRFNLAYRKFLAEHKGKYPRIMAIVGRQLTGIYMTSYTIKRGIYTLMNVLSKRWSMVSFGRKMLSGNIIFFGVVLYLAYLFLYRSLNSIMLSVNTFSTLGFGKIPVHGISRYVAIIEGFLGWFLLSIFSVSLINQLLQS